jgi:drug/metabolite transporter (DMT)-like permease
VNGAGDGGGSARAYPLRGVALVAVSAALFGANGTVSKLVLAAGIPPLQLAELRSSGAALVLCTAVLAVDPRALRLNPGDLALTAFIGVVGVALTVCLYFVALTRVPVGVALLVEFTAPVLVAVWIRFVRGGSMRRRVWPAAGLVLGGLALIAQLWTGLAFDGLGLLAAAADAVALAAYFLLGERCLGRCSPLAVAALSFLGSAVFLSVLVPWWTFAFDRLLTPVAIGPLVVPLAVLVVCVVLLGTVVPFVLELYGLRSIGATRTGLVGTLEPVLAGAIAWAVLDERLAMVQIIGAAVVVTGIVLAETAGSPHVAASPDAVAAGMAIGAGEDAESIGHPDDLRLVAIER